MTKKSLALVAILLFCSTAFAQKNQVDSLQKAYNKNHQDTTLVMLYFLKGVTVFLKTNVDSGITYSKKTLDLSRKIHFKEGEVRALSGIAIFQNKNNNLPGALKTTFQVLPDAHNLHEMRTAVSCYNTRVHTFSTLNDFQKALDN